MSDNGGWFSLAITVACALISVVLVHVLSNDKRAVSLCHVFWLPALMLCLLKNMVPRSLHETLRVLSTIVGTLCVTVNGCMAVVADDHDSFALSSENFASYGSLGLVAWPFWDRGLLYCLENNVPDDPVAAVLLNPQPQVVPADNNAPSSVRQAGG